MISLEDRSNTVRLSRCSVVTFMPGFLPCTGSPRSLTKTSQAYFESETPATRQETLLTKQPRHFPQWENSELAHMLVMQEFVSPIASLRGHEARDSAFVIFSKGS